MINVYEKFGEWKDINMGEFGRDINLVEYVVSGDEKKCKMYGECQQVKEKRMCLKNIYYIDTKIWVDIVLQKKKK